MLALESGNRFDTEMGAELVISLLVARNVMGNVLTLTPSARGKRDLAGSRGSDKPARIDRLSGMALAVQ